MGTNYYIQSEPYALSRDERDLRHIGKSSAGWCFGLHVYPENGINDLDDWLREFEAKFIFNEYGDPISRDEMVRIITARAWSTGSVGTPYGYRSREEFHRINCSQDGPNGLMRHRLGNGAVSHGAGTWDCLTGDFS